MSPETKNSPPLPWHLSPRGSLIESIETNNGAFLFHFFHSRVPMVEVEEEEGMSDNVNVTGYLFIHCF